jgi:pimeloyl-ACP methyl ester carboxylesterase
MPDRDSVLPSLPTTEAEELWTSVEGVRMRYLRAGSGHPLILLHGLLGYSFSWRFNAPVFARHRTVYAVDMPGAGYSERSKLLDYSFRGSAERLLTFANNLGLERFDLLATSHGGAVAMVAAGIAKQSPVPRIRSLVLVAPVNPWSVHGRDLAPFLARPVVSGLLGWCMPHMRFANGTVVRRLYGDARRISPGTVEGYSRPYVTSGSFDCVFDVLRTWNNDLEDLEKSFPAVAEIPTLLIWGTRDTAVDLNSARLLARRLGCALIEFPGVGHLPYEEVPEEFNAAVLKFLDSSSAGG